MKTQNIARSTGEKTGRFSASILYRLFAFSLILALLAAPIQMTPASASLPEQTSDTPVVARVYFSDLDELAQLANHLDIWEVHHDQGYLVALIFPEQTTWLTQSGYRMQLDAAKTALLTQERKPDPGQITGIPGYACYRTVEETHTDMQALATNHPTLATWTDIGNSWEKVTPGGAAGYDIYVLVLTNSAVPGPKPKFFLMAELHAREYATAELAARFAEHLIAQYNVDPDITWLLDYFEVHIVPMSNPDGRKHAEAGNLWRKNTDNDDGCSVSSSWGTDLNRNSSFHWGGPGASTNPCNDTYRGPSAASEPETLAIQIYVANNFPDQRGPGDLDPVLDTAMGTFITLHSYSELILWPWGDVYTNAPNHTQLQSLGRKFAYFTGYTAQQSVGLYPTSGATDDWAYGELGLAGYTFEIGTSFFQNCSAFESTIYPNNLQALLYAFKSTRLPYLNPGGPDSINVSVSASTVTPGTPVTLTASANGMRYANGQSTQNIAAARYSVDKPSWIDGAVTYPMAAQDGSFNSKIETVRATVDTTGLSDGRHTLYVESQDAAGNWGVTGSVFLNVESPYYGLEITPQTAAQSVYPGETVTYTLHVTNIGSNADTFDVEATGYTWATLSPSSVGPVPSQGGVDFQVSVTVPGTAVHAESDQTTLTLTSQADPTKSATATLVTTASHYALSIEADPLAATGDPGETVTYTLEITNLSLLEDTFQLTWDNTAWEISGQAEVGPLSAGESAFVPVGIAIPTDAIGNTSEEIVFTATSQGDDQRSASIAVTTSVNPLRGFYLTPVTSEKSSETGETVAYTLHITNTGNLSDTFDVTVSGNQWPISPQTDALTLEPYATGVFTVSVEVPNLAMAGDTDEATVLVVSRGDETLVAEASLVTTALPTYRVEVSPKSPWQAAEAGETAVYSLVVTNMGNMTDTFQVTISGNYWETLAPTSLGPLAPGETASFEVSVNVPSGVPFGMSDTARVSIISQGNAVRRAEAFLTTRTGWPVFMPIIFR